MSASDEAERGGITGITIAGYELHEEIGRGGMGVVYRARDSGFERDVAIKVLSHKVSADSFSAARFRNEARITGQLQHPGIPPVHELGTLEDGKPFLAMKLVKGATLAAMLEQRSSSNDHRGRFIAIFEQICHAMGYAHAHQVIHRDLKPSNVMVGKFGEVQIMDWGLAKVLGEATPGNQAEVDDRDTVEFRGSVIETPAGADSATRTGSILGTPAYMSPEQASGEVRRLDSRSDVFALGAILCEILTGRPPYVGQNANEVRGKAMRGELGDALKDLDQCEAESDLISLAKRCLSLYQLQRPDHGQEVADEVAKIRTDSELRARQAEVERSAAVVRETEGLKQRRQFLIAASVIGVALVLGIIGTGYGLLRAQESAEAERQAKEKAQTSAIEERKAKELAEVQRTRAENREEDAIDAVKRFGDIVTKNSELKNSPELGSLRTELLREPLTFFKSLRERLEAEKDVRPEAMARLGGAAFELGKLTSQIGDKQNAIQSINEAIAIQQKLARENPSVKEYQMDVAANQSNLAILLAETGKPKEAIELFRSSKAMIEDLIRAYPDSTALQSDLASNFSNTAKLLAEMNDFPKSLSAHDEAIAIRERLVKENLSNDEYLSNLADSYNNLGALFYETHKTKKAIDYYEKAKEIRERLANDHPTNDEFQKDLASCLCNLGLAHFAKGDNQKTLEFYTDALKIQKHLADEHPTAAEFQKDLAQCHNNLGQLFRALGKQEESIAAYEKACEALEQLAKAHPTVPDFQNELGGAQSNLSILHCEAKRYEVARELLESAIRHQTAALKTNPKHPIYLRFLKSHYSNMLTVASSLQNDKLIQETEQKLGDLAKADPQFEKLDSRMAVVLGGQAAENASEWIEFGMRSYDLRKYAQSARFYGDAFVKKPMLLASQDPPHAFNAACSAALASEGRGLDDPPLSDDAKTKWRSQALKWLQDDLARWEKAAEKPDGKEIASQTWKRWQEDFDLSSVRDATKLARLPESQQEEWRVFWRRVEEIRTKAEAALARPN